MSKRTITNSDLEEEGEGSDDDDAVKYVQPARKTAAPPLGKGAATTADTTPIQRDLDSVKRTKELMRSIDRIANALEKQATHTHRVTVKVEQVFAAINMLTEVMRQGFGIPNSEGGSEVSEGDMEDVEAVDAEVEEIPEEDVDAPSDGDD